MGTRPNPVRRLEVRDRCPDFALVADDDTRVSRQALVDQWFVLYFYPRDSSPGCTKQACGLRDEFAALRDLEVATFGISPDSPARHREFRRQHGLPFHLLSDEDHSVAEAFGVWISRDRAGRPGMGNERTTFVVGPDGIIEAVLADVHPEEHAPQLVDALREAIAGSTGCVLSSELAR